jgi:curli biogenesis system outer membrane secretion channel CsgG
MTGTVRLRAARAAGLLAMASLVSPALLTGCSTPAPTAREAASPTSTALKRLPRKNQEQRATVAVYEVSSNLYELPARGATEMFKSALVKSGQFRVVDRSRLSRSVMAEKQMNAAGQTTGATAQKQLLGAEYIFEAEITELAAGKSGSSTGVNIAGMNIGGASGSDTIGLDVSIVDAATGEVVDAVTVRRKLASSAASVSGVSALVGRVMADRGKVASAYTPDVSHTSTRKDSLDAGLRECVEEAVRLLALRFEPAVRP